MKNKILLRTLFAISILTNIYFVIKNNRTSGTLLIDKNGDEKDLYRFDIDDLDSLSKNKKIILKVNANANLSQK